MQVELVILSWNHSTFLAVQDNLSFDHYRTQRIRYGKVLASYLPHIRRIHARFDLLWSDSPALKWPNTGASRNVFSSTNS